MKRYTSIVLSILLITACGTKADYPWFAGSFDDAKANAGEKLIMLDFYATW
jgi:PBP1b-binding outer membrane lipoprotein LpoB